MKLKKRPDFKQNLIEKKLEKINRAKMHDKKARQKYNNITM
jgi:hypothetical protein